MKNLYIHSVIWDISEEIDRLIHQKKITSETTIAIYGLDRFSYAVKSLLGNRNYHVRYFVSPDEIDVMEAKRRILGFSNRYLNGMEQAVEPFLLGEDSLGDLKDAVVLVASQPESVREDILLKCGFFWGRNCFRLYDWTKDDFKEFTADKKTLQIRDMQLLEKDILKAFDDHCLQNGFRYWVCGGTLLGTIRHKGFIPWDDDIDVYMPYSDYCRFIGSYQDNDTYRVVSVEKEAYQDSYVDLWAKMVSNTTIVRENAVDYTLIHPVWIDIFPIVGMPKDPTERHNYFRRELELERRSTEAFYRGNGSIAAKNSIYPEFVKLFNEIDFDKAEQVGILGSAYREKDSTSRAAYDGTIRMPFEDITVNVSTGYREYLDNLYGPDWMEIPDESKRKSHHVLEAYWL